ncbi:MAG: Peptide-methionine (R)-S-oxide reductase MsrB, partial [uncultured Craurococcus sp.]
VPLPQGNRPRGRLPGAEDRRRMARQPLARGLSRAARARHGAPWHQPAECREAPWHLRLRRLRHGAFRIRHQIRERHRLAELLRPDRGQCRHHHRPQLLHDADGGALRPLRRPSRPCLPGRAAADRPPLLHERRLAPLRARSGGEL